MTKRSIEDYFKPITNQNNNNTFITTTTTVTNSKTRISPRKKTMEANKPPSNHSTTSSLSSLDPSPTRPVVRVVVPKPIINQSTSKKQEPKKLKDDDDDDDELPDLNLGLPITKTKIKSTPNHKSTPYQDSTPHQNQKSPSLSPSSAFNQARRRSTRLLTSTNKPSPSIPIGSRSKTIIKLSKPVAPAKFSLEQILKDQRSRLEKQAKLKRTREALGVSDNDEPIPDQPPNQDNVLLTPQKKNKHHDPHQAKNTTHNRLNSICIHDPDTPPPALTMADRTNELLIDTNTPSKSILLDEKEIDRFKTSNAQKPRIHQFLRDDLLSGQLSGLNLGLNYRQLFHPNLLNPSPTSNPPSPVPKIDYSKVEGVSKDPQVVDFVQELIDNLNFSITNPDALTTSLTRVIPESLTDGAIGDESETMITHQTIFSLLFRPLIDPEYPETVAGKTVALIENLLATLSATPYLNRLYEFWLNTLQDGLCRLGLLPHLVFFGNYSHEDSATLAPQNPSFAFTPSQATERVRLMLNLLVILSSASYLNDRGRIWALTIALRVGIEPTSSQLRADAMEVISEVTTKVYYGSPAELTTKETKISLLVEALKVGLDAHLWTNQLDVVRLFPAHLPFRKALVIGLIDLAVAHLENPRPMLDEVLYKMARWLAHITNKFTTDPPIREIYNTLKEVSRRPHEPVPISLPALDPTGGVDGASTESMAGTEGSKSLIKGGKFRKAFAGYLESEQSLNEVQFSALVMLFQTLTIGIWDALIDSKNLPHSSNPPATPLPSSSALHTPRSAPPPLPGSKLAGNTWITLVHQALGSLDHSIKSAASPQNQADRIKLKNIILRLATALDFLNRESVLIVKGIDTKGQTKLDKFLKKT